MGDFHYYLQAAVNGPFALRFIVQPVLAVLLGVRDGRRDSRTGAPPYGMHLLTGKGSRLEILHEGIRQIVVPLCLGVALDIAVHFMLSYGFRPLSSLAVGTLLVGLPYIIARGVTNRLMTGHRRRAVSGEE